MDLQFVYINLIHKFVTGRPMTIKELTDRVIVQKIIYLADIMGVYTGNFNFSWYKKGPYSPALTRLLYNYADDVGEPNKEYELSKEVEEILSPLKQIVSLTPSDLSESDWIELVASLHYLYDENSGDSPDKIMNKLIEIKPKYSKSQLKNSWKVLEEMGLID